MLKTFIVEFYGMITVRREEPRGFFFVFAIILHEP